jgi:hypothetical protein
VPAHPLEEPGSTPVIERGRGGSDARQRTVGGTLYLEYQRRAHQERIAMRTAVLAIEYAPEFPRVVVCVTAGEVVGAAVRDAVIGRFANGLPDLARTNVEQPEFPHRRHWPLP